MGDDREKMNGSVNRLADAMREVFSEAVEGAVDPLREEMKALRTDVHDMEERLNERIDATNKNVHDMEERLNERIDTTNKNVQAQFAEQEKKIGQMLRGR